VKKTAVSTMDYSAIINEYKKTSFGCVCDSKIIEYCKASPDLKTAIKRAALARDEKEKKFIHQYRIKNDTLRKLDAELLKIKNKIKTVNNFDELFELVHGTRVFKSRYSLTVYDTALRLGFYLKKYPERIYLHAGAKKGAEKVMGKIRKHFIMKNDLPEPFRSCGLKEYELEDLFCVYKDKLRTPA